MSRAMDPKALVTSSCQRLFDVAQLANLLAEDAHVRSRLGEPPYSMKMVRYWPQGSPQIKALQVEWSIQTSSGATHSLFGQQSLGGKISQSLRQRKATKADGDAYQGINPGVFWMSEDDALVIHSPECDGSLTQLATCLSTQAMEPRLNAFGFHASSGAGSLACRLAGYRANRRAAIRYCFDSPSAPGTSLLGKTFRDMRGRELIRRHMLVSGALRKVCGTRVRVPASVGFDPELQLAIFFWMNGTSLESLPRGHGRWLESTVDALAAIHELSIGDLPIFKATDEAAIVRRWSEAIRHIAPEMHVLAGKTAETLSQLSSEIRSRHLRTIHRDFYEKQVVVADDGVTVLDLDTLSVGDPAVDLGNLLAHLYLNSVHDPAKSAESARQSATFLDCWECRCGPVDRKSLKFFTASALFRLGAVHALRSQTGSLASLLWRAATQISDGAPDAMETVLAAEGNRWRHDDLSGGPEQMSDRQRSRRLAG